MIITRDVEETIAVVDWTDDCRVMVSQRKARTKYTIAEARALRAHLDKAISEASKAADDLVVMSPPARFDVARLSPDCAAGEKHRACIGTAWDFDADVLTGCTCVCHTEAAVA